MHKNDYETSSNLNKTMKIMNFASFGAQNFKSLYKKLGFLDINEIHEFEISKFMFKYYNNFLPEKFSNYFTLNTEIHCYNTRGRNNTNFYVSRARTNIGKKIKYEGSKVWNNIPLELKSLNKLSAFKIKYKEYILDKE